MSDVQRLVQKYTPTSSNITPKNPLLSSNYSAQNYSFGADLHSGKNPLLASNGPQPFSLGQNSSFSMSNLTKSFNNSSNQQLKEPTSVTNSSTAVYKSATATKYDTPTSPPSSPPKHNYLNSGRAASVSTFSVQTLQTYQSASNLEKVKIMYEEGLEHYKAERYQNSHDSLRECLKMYQKLDKSEQDQELLANILMGQGVSFYTQGFDDLAMKSFNNAMMTLEQKFGKHYPGRVSMLVNLALICIRKKENPDAMKYLDEAQKLAENVFGYDRLCLADVHHNKGVIFDLQNEIEKAIDCYSKSLKIRSKIVGEESITCAQTMENLAVIYKDLKQYQKAIDLESKVMQMRKKDYGETSHEFAISCFYMGQIYYENRQLSYAQTFLTKAHKVFEMITDNAKGQPKDFVLNSQEKKKTCEKYLNDIQKRQSFQSKFIQ